MILRLYETTPEGVVQEASYRGYRPAQVPDDWFESVRVCDFHIMFRNRTSAAFPTSEGRKQLITHFGINTGRPISLNSPKLVRKGDSLTFSAESVTLSTVIHGA